MKKEIKLERKLSPVNIWALAFGCIIGAGAFVLPGTLLLNRGGPLGAAIAIVIGALTMIIIAANYGYMIKKFPRAGGEFLYTKNAFGRTSAFICIWYLGLSYLMIVPFNATALSFVGRTLFGNYLQFGFSYSVAGYTVYLGELLLAVIILILFAWLSIKGTKITGTFQTVLSFVIVSVVVLLVVFSVASDKSTVSNLSPGFYSNENHIGQIMSVATIAPMMFVGFDTIPQATEEMNFSMRKTKKLMFISILFGAAVYIILNTVAASVIPDGYNTWVEYINDIGNLEGLASIPTFYAAKELMGTGGLILIGMAVVSAILSGIIGFYMATSRLFYSLAKEKMIPSWFGKLNNKYKTPSNAIIFIMLFSLIAPFFGRTALGWIIDMASLGAAIGYGFTSASALKYAIKEKKVMTIITGAVGSLISIAILVLLLVPIEGLPCSLTTEPYICLIIWTILGIIFFLYSKMKKKKKKNESKKNMTKEEAKF